jgi:RNA polymerase sigma factor (sigma-70 family)
VKKNEGNCSGAETWRGNRNLSKSVQTYADASHWTEEEVLIRYEAWMTFVIDRATVNLPPHYKANWKEDLEQEARIALLLCWRDYQKQKALCKFSTFSFLRIRGAVIDYFRDRKSVTNPTPYATYVSVDFSNEESRVISGLEQQSLDHQFEPALHNSMDLNHAIQALEVWERKLLELYYSRDETLKEIGERADVTEGRVCQIHAEVIARLRRCMDTEPDLELI